MSSLCSSSWSGWYAGASPRWVWSERKLWIVWRHRWLYLSFSCPQFTLYRYLSIHLSIYLSVCSSLFLSFSLSVLLSLFVCQFSLLIFIFDFYFSIWLYPSILLNDFSSGLAIRGSEMTAWAGSSKCCPAPANCMYCPLCLASVEDANEAWKEHLIHRCPENKRGSSHK